MAHATTDATFEADVLKSEVPVLVDFWAQWCGPCRALGPVIEELSKELEGKAKVFKLDVDTNQQTAAEYGIQSIPTVIVFRGGKPTKQFVGMKDKKTYLDALK